MPQMHLPCFPDGVEHITSELAFERKDGQVTYFNGHMPVSIHAEEDILAFRVIAAQFCLNGNAKQADISRAFGITLISFKRAVKLYWQKRVAGFYEELKRRGPVVLTAQELRQAQELLEEGLETSEVAEQLGVKRDTLAKAIGAGRLHKPPRNRPRDSAKHQVSTQQRRRSGADGGVGACNVLDRMAASVGGVTAVEPVFQAVSDVPHGGVLFALPALLAVGLLHQAHNYFRLPKGYYGLESLFLMLAFLALARQASLEQLR